MNSSKSDEKEKRGISLRKKRTVKPKISAPKQISGPLPINASTDSLSNSSVRTKNSVERPGLPGAPKPRPRPQNGDTTADLIQRRYSTRFANLPPDFDASAPPVPSVPKITGSFAVQPPSRDGRPSTDSGTRIQIDIKALSNPGLKPDQYVSSLLADASEEAIQNYQYDLREAKNRTSADLTQNVFRNRSQFIKISKEAEKLKGEMRTLRNLMAELTGALGQATLASGGSNSNASADTKKVRRIANRSSVANLEALWNTQLAALWKRVEGSQKYLPAIPGRHIVYENFRWVELNSATWKPRRRVYIILLNDHFLVAAEKKRADGPAPGGKQTQGQGQLVAVRCWPLQDVQLADLSTRALPGGAGQKSPSSNAINVRVGTESYTFATGSADAEVKMQLLTNFRRAQEDLRKSLEEEENLNRDKRSDVAGYWAGRDPGVLQNAELVEAITETSTPRSDILIDVDGKPQSLRWVESQIDELDIDIALQRFEAAVSRVEKFRRIAKGIKNNNVAQSLITLKLNERAAKLEHVIVRYLKDTPSWMTATKRHVDWLVRLGFEDRAREAYLEARTETIKKHIRQVIFEGDLQHYIYQLAFITFTSLKDTALIYQACFPMAMMSACVKWVKEHVDDFNAMLERQLSSVEKESETYTKCMEIALEHCAVLGEAGLDFKNMVGVKSK
ncbi:uncharacterized protein PV09_06750 [Verruconis gallopava]|uniref:Exocyst complex component EXO84 n=1 Tax=Verruconis gallopava TaxID=253628 RepID=A0A0D2ARV1_9PEZI|nr:uncharacterized protein PV09_06750 [Verruconis gallopava]KIW01909.1 hypothetical protein PV09_06750 [Verruconis gallopava]